MKVSMMETTYQLIQDKNAISGIYDYSKNGEATICAATRSLIVVIGGIGGKRFRFVTLCPT